MKKEIKIKISSLKNCVKKAVFSLSLSFRVRRASQSRSPACSDLLLWTWYSLSHTHTHNCCDNLLLLQLCCSIGDVVISVIAALAADLSRNGLGIGIFWSIIVGFSYAFASFYVPNRSHIYIWSIVLRFIEIQKYVFCSQWWERVRIICYFEIQNYQKSLRQCALF